MTGNKVADIEINGSKGKLVKEENCTVTDLVKKGSTISFDYLAKSLPYPVDTLARSWGMSHPQAEALNIVPFVEEMNQEVLKVTGLKGIPLMHGSALPSKDKNKIQVFWIIQILSRRSGYCH